MDLNIDFGIVRSQKLLFTPQLKQAFEILKMNSQQLFRYINEQIQINPALEICKDDSICENDFLNMIRKKYFKSAAVFNQAPEDDYEFFGDINDIINNMPAAGFYFKEYFPYIIYDATVKKVENSYEVFVNEEAIPDLIISEYYKQIVSNEVSLDTKRFIQNKINSAKWLIKCIEERKNILRKIAQYLVNNMYEFFERGKEYLKPLDIEKSSKELSLHKQVLINIIKDKYLHCRWGSFEIRCFFKKY